MLEQNAFAAAARSHDDKYLAGVDFEVNAFEDFLAIEALAQSAHLHADAVLGLIGRADGCSFHGASETAGEEIIQDDDQHDAVDHGLGDRAANAARAADGLQSLMAGNHADDQRENESF